MALDDFHRRVATVALTAAAKYGFALGGGNALIAHGIIDRLTEDVDLFTDDEHGVEASAVAVEAALRAAGLEPGRQDKTAGLSEIFPGMGDGLAEWSVTAPGRGQMILQMAYFDRARSPVIMDIGPVLDLEDVVGGRCVPWRAEHMSVTTQIPRRRWTTTPSISSSPSPDGWTQVSPIRTSRMRGDGWTG